MKLKAYPPHVLGIVKELGCFDPETTPPYIIESLLRSGFSCACGLEQPLVNQGIDLTNRHMLEHGNTAREAVDLMLFMLKESRYAPEELLIEPVKSKNGLNRIILSTLNPECTLSHIMPFPLALAKIHRVGGRVKKDLIIEASQNMSSPEFLMYAACLGIHPVDLFIEDMEALETLPFPNIYQIPNFNMYDLQDTETLYEKMYTNFWPGYQDHPALFAGNIVHSLRILKEGGLPYQNLTTVRISLFARPIIVLPTAEEAVKRYLNTRNSRYPKLRKLYSPIPVTAYMEEFLLLKNTDGTGTQIFTSKGPYTCNESSCLGCPLGNACGIEYTN